MTKLYEMNDSIQRKVGDKLARLAAPLVEHLGVNHFYHYIITDDGHIATLGLNQEWQEYLSDHDVAKKYMPFFYQNRQNLKGVMFNQAVKSKDWNNLTSLAEKKFSINLSLQITQSTEYGMEGIGFSLKTNDFAHHMALVNELPLLKLFISEYKKKVNSSILKDNFVNLKNEFGVATKRSNNKLSSTRELLLRDMKLAMPISFSRREGKVVQQLLKGCPTSAEIAAVLFISTRTVEDHIARIKDKLDCSTKSQLMLKLQELESFDFL